ncbi:Polyol:NADP oxidoreductase [Serratia fonticola]|uniref:Polyol:NADP oxidoreductase n=1 Tax=Serratia fonticola TaxID=47917 RepID=A0A4U9WI45_SERFO|nr:Polyol:NADP oxidoreductase [Serratia fonticola]
MSCDNMPENGHVTRNVITAYAKALDPALATWIETYVTFPSTMVDRIVPAVTPDTLAQVAQQTGVQDPAAVACEPFRQWVIEDNFVAGRPVWEQAGAELVSNVLPFEEMKLRMLNGSHSFLAYLGYLAGYPHISDCMQDEHYVKAARHLMLAEQAPTLNTLGTDLEKLRRFPAGTLSQYGIEAPHLADRHGRHAKAAAAHAGFGALAPGQRQ